MVRRRRGAALLLAMATIVVVAVAGQVLYGALSADFRAFRAEERQAVLRALTDASLASTLELLSREPSTTGLSKQRLGPGFIESRVRPVGDGLLEVTASAQSGPARESIVARVAKGPRVVSWERQGPRPGIWR